MPYLRKNSLIPLFDCTPHHSFVSTEVCTASGRSGCPGRPLPRRVSALPWTAASTLARPSNVGRIMGFVTMVAFSSAMAISLADAQTGSRAGTTGVVLPGDSFTTFIDEASRRFAVPALWVRLVLQAESGGDARAVSPKGALGLMQIMPQTYARLRQVYGLGADALEPRNNVLAGTAYLRDMYDRYGAPGFLAAYNAGPGRYGDHLATGRPLPQETQLYLARLAPLVAGAQTGRSSAAPDPLGWFRAPLFIAFNPAPAPMAEKPARTAADQAPALSSAKTAAPDVAALHPQSGGLFVRTVSAVRPQ